jgi:diaminopimelate epimerase
MQDFKGTFYKYQATGNDFVMIDNRNGGFPSGNQEGIAQMCHRRFGVGADGLILLEKDPDVDFRMVYFNADGAEGSMCGNGGRCAIAFAKFLGIDKQEYTFRAVDGLHCGVYGEGGVDLQMGDVSEIRDKPKYCFLDTGSPHHVQVVPDLDKLKVAEEGRKLRYGLYGEAGSNINFVGLAEKGPIRVRTYERGVEAETYSCGTGITAVALALHRTGRIDSREVEIDTAGGSLSVRFTPLEDGSYTDIWLTGPARQVFKGEWL